jgi:hypothetical protein
VPKASVEGPHERQNGRTGKWLRRGLFSLFFIAIPLSVYFFYYVNKRLDQTRLRDFHALAAVADRLAALIQNQEKVAKYAPVVLKEEAFARVLQLARRSLQDIEKEEKATGASIDKTQADLMQVAENLGALPANTAAPSRSRLEGLFDQLTLKVQDLDKRRHELSLSTARDCDHSALMTAIKLIDPISRAYMSDLDAATSTHMFQVGPLVRASSRSPASQGHSEDSSCDDRFVRAVAEQMAKQGRLSECTDETITRHLIISEEGVQVEARDCRPFSERSESLSRALSQAEYIEALDHFGVRVVANLSDLVASVARNVAPLFDQYVITDDRGGSAPIP